MAKTCWPIWKRQARETSPCTSGTDLRQSVAFRQRILPKLSPRCANQDRCPNHAIDRSRSAQFLWSLAALSALQTCISFELLDVWPLCPVSCWARIDYRRANPPRPVPVSTCASMEHKPAPHPGEETLSAVSSSLVRDRNVRRSKSGAKVPTPGLQILSRSRS